MRDQRCSDSAAERTLMFTKAMEIAQGLETAAKIMRELTKGASHEASQAKRGASSFSS